jgi:PAS domain S-box-containing protein
MRNDDMTRRAASQIDAGRAPNEPAPSRETLLHELQVHQIELQMQNEELLLARDELAAGLKRYTDLYEFAPVGYFTLDLNGQILGANLAGAALLAREAGALKGVNFVLFLPKESLPAFNLLIARAFGGRHRQSCEIELRSREGSFSAHVEALVDHARNECRLAVVDVSEHKRGEAIRESEQRFHVALDGSPITVFEQDLFLHYTWIHNPMLGLAVQDVIGRGNGELMDAASASRLEALLRQVIADGSAVRAEVAIGKAGCAPLYWDLSLHPRRNAAGETTGVIGAATDVSGRKQIERALQTAKSEAERADNAKSRFLAAASHDLRQPLGALALYVDILKSKVAARDAILVEHIKGCVSSMSMLLNDLLDVSKLTAGVVKPQFSDFSINDMLAHLVAVHAPAAELKGLRLRHRRCALTAHTDPVWFARVLGNLVANAVDYTERGGALIACRKRSGKMWVEVRDTGIGIPADMTAEIFEEFRQLGDTSRTRGSGLGLAIVARAAALLGLEIRVRSRIGKGSMFAIELPLGKSAGDAAPGRASAEPARTLRIALVEDNVAVLQALSYVLQSAGHRVVAAASRRALMRNLGDVVPDIVISDYRLPDNENGFDVISAVRRTFGAELPAIIITGDTDPAIIAEMARHDILIQHKPIDAQTLEACIAEATDRT